MRLSLALIFISVLLLPDLYILLAFFRRRRWWWALLHEVPLLLALASAGAWMGGVSAQWPGQLLFFVIVCFSLPKLVFSVLSLLVSGVALWAPQCRKPGLYFSLFVGGCMLLASVYGCSLGRHQLTVHQQELHFSDLPAAFDGYKIVQISDLHLGTYGHQTRFIERVVREVNAQNPDLIVVTGDLVNIKAEELVAFQSCLSQLHARDGVMTILGNHDYGTYGRFREADGQAKNLEKLKRGERALGWDLLLDEHRFIHRGTDSIALLGVQNIGAPPFPKMGSLELALDGVDSHVFKILLSHDPSHWRMEVLPNSNIQLMLAGHTHAMQLKLGHWSPAIWKYPEWGGLYQEGDRQLFISTGIGGTIPFRLGAAPEICVLTLRK